jgi:hypothetical protein
MNLNLRWEGADDYKNSYLFAGNAPKAVALVCEETGEDFIYHSVIFYLPGLQSTSSESHAYGQYLAETAVKEWFSKALGESND